MENAAENISPIIGTLSERSLHAAIKSIIEPDRDKCEQRYRGFVADIRNDSGIFEIQTKNFAYLRRKLDAFLPDNIVTVVYPAIRQKWIIWVDPESGELSPRRRSPKTGSIYDVFPELYALREYMNHPNFRLKVIETDATEYRYAKRGLKDKRRNGRRGHERCELVPVSIGGTVDAGAGDYAVFIPDELKEREGFTSADFALCAKIDRSLAQYALNVLNSSGVVERTDRKKSGYIYRYVPKSWC